MPNRKLLIILTGFLILAAAVIAALFAFKPIAPASIRREVTSTLLVPRHADVKVDPDSYKFESSLKLLTLTATAFGHQVTISEQPTPQAFTDIPQAYDKLVEQMGEYSKFDVDSGTVHLTHPKDLNGKQAAVLNTKGTLMFIKPDADLSDDQWRQLMGSLTVVR